MLVEDDRVYGPAVTKQTEPVKVLIGLQEAHRALDRLFDKLQPVMAFRDSAKEAVPEKVQSVVVAEVEMLNRRLADLLRNIDL